MSVLLRKQYSTIKKEKLSEQAKSVLKSMYDTTNGFKDLKATRKIKPKFEAFYNKLKESKPEAIVGGKAKSKAAPKKSADDFKAARARRKPQTGVPKDKKAVDKDATRPAISKIGRRVSKAGNTYYEYRENRFDKNPSKYPMLEKGGYMAKGGEMVNWEAPYGNTTLKFKGKILEDKGNYYVVEYNNYESGDMNATTHVYKSQVVEEKMAKGGYMAKGGELDNLLKEQEELEFQLTDIKLGSDLNTDEGVDKYRKLVAPVRAKLNEIDKKLEALGYEPYAKGGYMAQGGQLEVGDMVMVDDSGYAKYFSGFDVTKPAKIISKNKGKSFGKVKYFYGLETADGKKPFNQAIESMLTKVSKDGGMMAHGGEIVRNGSMEGFSVGDKVKYKGKRSKYMATVLKVVDDKNLPYAEIKFDDKDKVEEAYLDDLVKLDLRVADEYVNPNYMAHGGETHRLDSIFEDGGEIAEGNLEMAMSNVKAIEHHAEELKSLLDENTSIEAWVVAKLERAETDLSDVTHYIDGLKDEEVESDTYFEDGGSIPNNYEGMHPREVWNAWSLEQKRHFLVDHNTHPYSQVGLKKKDREEIAEDFSYDDLPKNIKLVISDHIEDGQYARGGFVSKGELVWRKLSDSKKMEFLYENFTPQITPRSQETLVGKDFQFLPKDVKIKLEAKYANVEEYAKGGRLSRKQKQLDLNKNGKLDSQDFKMLRAGRKNARKK